MLALGQGALVEWMGESSFGGMLLVRAADALRGSGPVDWQI